MHQTVHQEPQKIKELQIHCEFKAADRIKQMNLLGKCTHYATILHMEKFDKMERLASHFSPCPYLIVFECNLHFTFVDYTTTIQHASAYIHIYQRYFGKLVFAFQCTRSSTSQACTSVHSKNKQTRF